MSIFSSWTSSNILSMFCFNLPLVMQTKLCAILSSQRNVFGNLAMHWWHSVIVDEIINLYDESIWSIRDLVRDIEIVRTLMSALDLRYINDFIDRTGLQIKIWRQTSLYSTTLLVTHCTLPKHLELPNILYHPWDSNMRRLSILSRQVWTVTKHVSDEYSKGWTARFKWFKTSRNDRWRSSRGWRMRSAW